MFYLQFDVDDNTTIHGATTELFLCDKTSIRDQYMADVWYFRTGGPRRKEICVITGKN